MDITKVNDLKRKIFLRSALIPVNSLNDILSLNDNFTADEILTEIIKKSLRAFEYHYPLVTEFKVHKSQLCGCKRGDGWCEIKSNFKLFHECKIGEDQIILVPNATPKLRIAASSGMGDYYGSYPSAGNYSTSDPVAYERPFIFLGNNLYDVFYMRGIYSRPAVFDFEPDNTFSGTSAIYWMNIEEGVLGQKFIDQCMVDLLDYIRGLNSNLSLPSMPVQMFGAIDTYYMNIKQELDNFYLQSSWRGDLLV